MFVSLGVFKRAQAQHGILRAICIRGCHAGRQRAKRNVVRMDTACGDITPDVMKIDTQGFELEVLRGAGSCWTTWPQ